MHTADSSSSLSRLWKLQGKPTGIFILLMSISCKGEIPRDQATGGLRVLAVVRVPCRGSGGGECWGWHHAELIPAFPAKPVSWKPSRIDVPGY